MPLELKQQLRLSQQLVMTPQLQQAIKLLQLSRLELTDLVQNELQENPVLEELVESEDDMSSMEVRETEGAGDSGETASEAQSAGETDPDPDGDQPVEIPTADLDPAAAEIAEDLEAVIVGPELEPTDAQKVADIDWERYMEAYPQTGMREVREDDDRSLENMTAKRETLAEHLRWQLKLTDVNESDESIAEFILGNLDERGYLRATTEEIARQTGELEEAVEATLAKVQDLDPPGVAARDLKECLSLQVKAHGIRDSLVLRIIDEVLDALIRRDFRGVSRALGVTVEEVAAAAKVIGRLEPRPGRAYGTDDPVYIVPDIYVYKIADDFHVVLNDDGLPRLRVSSMYREVMSRSGVAEKDTKTYVHDKVRSAMWLIKSIQKRQRTIHKVMRSIIKFQREFFDHGINHLKPLNLRDVADDIEMHESTVSRVTTNKYVHTSQGIFELKYFFNSSINRVDGEAMASESVKERIHKLIRSEDPRRPLSDQRIAEMLKVANIDIARRTVTKYREALNILSSTKRRQVG